MIITLFGILTCIILTSDTGVVAQELPYATCSCPTGMIAERQVKCYSTETKTKQPSQEADIPTVYPGEDCEPKAKAKVLYAAIGGSAYNSDPVIEVLVHCTRSQRVAIIQQFEAQYGGNFLYNIESKFDYWFHDAIAALVRPLPEFWARHLHWSVKGPGTNEQTIIQILTALNNSEIEATSRKYKELFGSNLKDDILDDLSGKFAELADAQLSGVRREDLVDMDEAEAAELAKKMRQEGQRGDLELDNSLFYTTITTRSYPQLRKIGKAFARLGYTLQSAIAGARYWGWDLRAYAAFATYAEGKAVFFTEELKIALDHVATSYDLRSIIRIITWRADIDLGNIERAYAQYSQRFRKASLADLLKFAANLENEVFIDSTRLFKTNATSGATRKLILALAGY